jgi:hypothetical protein
MNPDIIKIEVIKRYDRRNKELANFNLVSLYGGEPQLITKEEHDKIDDKNRVMRNADLAFSQYLSKWEK